MDNKKHINGFTIVELLVVAIIIAILAVLGTVSYKTVMRSAVEAGLKADIKSAENIIGNYLKKYNEYPYSFDANFCPLDSSSAVDTDFCLEPSSDNSYSAYTVNNSLNPPAYSITVTNANGTSIVGGKSAIVLPTTPITAIGSTTGNTTAIGSIMTAGALTPSSATASYQWQSATTAGGTYTNISGATNSTYTLTISDVGKYLKVIATGTGSYGGTQTSTASAIISDANWLAVGNQVWGKYNLNVGTVVAYYEEQTNNAAIEKYCLDDIEPGCSGVDANGIVYGGLYLWPEAMNYTTTAGAQGICPTNSHIPTDNDWKILEVQLGMTQVQADATGWRGTTEGTKLKSGGSSGINIPLAGMYEPEGSMSHGSVAYLWSSATTQLSSFDRSLSSSNATVFRNTGNEGTALSVRCVGN